MTLPESEQCQSESPPAKKLKREESPQPSTSTWCEDYSLLDFCDDLMLQIFSYLQPSDLLILSQCCKRLQRIVRDRSLWTNVDLRLMGTWDSDLRKYTKFLLPSTKVLALKGPWVPRPRVTRVEDFLRAQEQARDGEPPSLSIEFLESVAQAAPNLQTLIIENHILDSNNISWDKMPPKIQHLSMQRCTKAQVDPTKSFFLGIDKSLTDLKTLNLSECHWFESHSLLALSKCEKLEELRLADCQISDFVPYVSLGTRFGFKSLTVIDFRRTWVSDREVSCLNKTPNLHELYLESPGGESGATLISDMAVTAFGATLEMWNQLGYFVLLMPEVREERFTPSPLRVIELRDYSAVTDTSLRHCATCLKGLQRIDVRGTSCSQDGVMKFMRQRPDVVIESHFSLEEQAEGAAVPEVDNN